MQRHETQNTSISQGLYQFAATSLKLLGNKNVSNDAQLCPIIAKGQRALNAQLTHQIVDRHYEELKFSGPDSQTLLRIPFNRRSL